MTDQEVKDAIASALRPGRFFVLPPADLAWEEVPREELFWEIFQGRLLDGTATRERRTFHAWNMRLITDGVPSAAPIVAIKRDLADGRLFVTRAILCHGHQTVANGNVIETHEAQIWSRELVGQIDPEECTPGELRRELAHLVFMAVVGSGRLPLTSLEAPLPDFSLGRLGYLPECDGNSPIRDVEKLAKVRGANQPDYAAKRLELFLRSPIRADAIPVGPGFLSELRAVFLGVSLSPYTDFVSRTMAMLRAAESQGTFGHTNRIDYLSWLIRLQWRHLNAYDLFLFHHRGANYPDALLIEEVLHELIACADANREIFDGPTAKHRRRALALGWILRSIYAGHGVPAQPTSPGENLRVMPAPWQRLSDEEIFNPYGRSRKLFDDPLALPGGVIELLKSAIQELSEPGNVAELGTALLLDRPLGRAKSVGEPDLTPMLAFIGRSRKLAFRHLDALKKRGDYLMSKSMLDRLRSAIECVTIPGIPLRPLHRSPRPGVVSLEDAFQTADDFVLDRTTASSARAFRNSFDLSALGERGDDPESWRLILPFRNENEEILRVFDSQYRPRLKLAVDALGGFKTRRGVELPRNGLVANIEGEKCNLAPSWQPSH